MFSRKSIPHDGGFHPPLDRVLDNLKNVRQENGGWKASCPAPGHGQGRGDLKPSLSVFQGDIRVVLKCHVGCEEEDVLDALGLEKRDLFPQPNNNGKNGRRKIVEIYDYTDEDEKPLFQGLRYEPKGFSQRKPDGTGGWIYEGVFKNGTRPVLYRLPKVIAAVREGRTVWIAEGEKDVHRLEQIGLTATTNPMGAEKWPDNLSEPLVGAIVRIVGDNDEAGRRHVRKVARSLRGKARDVRVVELPGAPEDGGDVSDWLDSGGTAEGLRALPSLSPEELEPPKNDSGPASTNPLLAGRMLLGEAMVNGVEPPEELEPGILLKGKVHHIFAAGGLGKTMLALWLAKRRIERGERVVYFDDENGPRTVSERLQDMGADPTKVDENLFYVPFQDLPLTPEGRHHYREFLEVVKPSLVVFDSWIAFLASAGLNENENTDIQAWCSTYTQTARALGIAAVLLDHVPHEGSRARGASRKRDEADVQWQLHKTQDFDRNSVGEITLHCEKDRDAWLPPSVTFSVGGTEDGKLVFQRSAGTIEEPDPAGGLTPNGRKLLDVLRARFTLTGANASEWAKAAKLPRQAVYRVRDDLKRLRLIRIEGPRYYPVTGPDGGGETVTSDPEPAGHDVTPEPGDTGQGVTPRPVHDVTPESVLPNRNSDLVSHGVTSRNIGSCDTPAEGVSPCTTPLKGGTGVTPPGTPPEDERDRKASDPVYALLADPPDWLATQLDKCREHERFVKPTCATAATELFGTVTRWGDVEPALRRWLEKEEA